MESELRARANVHTDVIPSVTSLPPAPHRPEHQVVTEIAGRVSTTIWSENPYGRPVAEVRGSGITNLFLSPGDAEALAHALLAEVARIREPAERNGVA